MSKSSIIILKSSLDYGGGAEKYALRIARAFHDIGHPVTLLTSGEETAEPFPFKMVTHTYQSKLSFRKVASFDRFCTQYLSQYPAEIVFGLDRNRFQTHLRASNGVHAAYLERRKKSEGVFKGMTFPYNPLHRTILQFEKTAFENPSLKKLFVNSHMVQREVLTHYRVDPQIVEVVHNGVEWKEMESVFAAWPTVRKPEAPFTFLFLGHNFQRKGLSELLHSLPLLSTPFRLWIVGHDKNLLLFKDLVKKLHLDRYVTFWGEQKEVFSFYQHADCLVIPSHYDPFANVTLEALAMGLFVVSSKENGAHEILTPETGAVIEDLNQPEAIATSLKKAMTFPKTEESATRIRQSVASYDFSAQLRKFIEAIA